MNMVVLGFGILAISGIQYKNTLFNDPLAFNNTNYVRGICILFVIFHHLFQRMQETSILSFVLSKVMTGYLPVSLFFFYYGFGLIYSYKTKKQYLETFFSRRISTILIPYLFFILLYWIISFFNQSPYTVMEIIISLFNGRPIVEYSWYIIVILLFYSLFYLMMRVYKRDYTKILICAALGCVIWIIICHLRHFDAYWYNTCVCIPFGILVGIYKEQLIKVAQKYYCLLLLIFVIAMCLCFGISITLEKWVLLKTIFLALSCLSFVVTVQIFMMKFSSNNKLWPFLSTISLELYLVHGLILDFFRGNYIFIKSNVLYSLTVVFFSIVAAYVLHLLFVKIKKHLILKTEP